MPIRLDEIKQSYLESQSWGDRQAIDARNSEERDPTFWERAVAKFNDESWLATTEAIPDLHSDYIRSKEIHKSDFDLTIEKAKKLISEFCPKLSRIIDKYEQSGNGSNMNDSGNEDDKTIHAGHPKWGKYNTERAARKNGDDRASFLNGESPCLLYWWHVLDQHDLLNFTRVELSDLNAASSDSIPRRTASVGSSARKKHQSTSPSKFQKKLQRRIEKNGRGKYTNG